MAFYVVYSHSSNSFHEWKYFFHEKKELCLRKKIFFFMKIIRSDVFFVSEILSRNSDIVMLLRVY